MHKSIDFSKTKLISNPIKEITWDTSDENDKKLDELLPDKDKLFIVVYLDVRKLSSSDAKTFSSFCFSVFIILPFDGIMLWNLLSLACFAEPPAESPSTTINSFTLLSFKVHTAIFPARGAVPFPTFFFSASLIFLIFSLL